MVRSSKRNAFSMIELIFVIVILGIVSSIGAEIIANIYESYILQRAQHRASLKTELAATQIANRLRYMIPGTVYRIRKDTNATESVESALAVSGELYKGLQWVAYDGDSFEAITSDSDRKPGWSGFCDINPSNATSLATPGSNLDLASGIINNLGGDINNAEIYFPNREHYGIKNTRTGETIDFDTAMTSDDQIYEQYKLAWSSYALVTEGGDLYLYYNFSPIPETPYGNGSKSLLMKSISTFKFKGAGQTIRFKLCKEENIGEDFNITSCKEKAVF